MGTMSMEEKVLILVRHAESEKNTINLLTSDINGWPLTTNGIQMAEQAANVLKALPEIDAFYTSPVLRAVQTADILGRYLDIDPASVDYRLKERAWGSLEQRSEPEDPTWKLNGAYGHEQWINLTDRMRSFMTDLNSGLTLAVSHGDNLSAACDVIDKKGEAACLYCPPFCHFAIIDLKQMEIVAKDTNELTDEFLSKFD